MEGLDVTTKRLRVVICNPSPKLDASNGVVKKRHFGEINNLQKECYECVFTIPGFHRVDGIFNAGLAHPLSDLIKLNRQGDSPLASVLFENSLTLLEFRLSLLEEI